jgi:hypothetical protein
MLDLCNAAELIVGAVVVLAPIFVFDHPNDERAAALRLRVGRPSSHVDLWRCGSGDFLLRAHGGEFGDDCVHARRLSDTEILRESSSRRYRTGAGGVGG